MGHTLKDLIKFAIKTNVIKFVSISGRKETNINIDGHVFHVDDCGMEEMDHIETGIKVLSKEDYRELVEAKIEDYLQNSIPEAEERDRLISVLEEAYIEPDDKLHLCVGFYSNGDFKCNTVPGKDIADNIEYNNTWRPGRAYFVDGKHVCGGMLKEPYMTEFIKNCQERIKELDLKPKSHSTRPYE